MGGVESVNHPDTVLKQTIRLGLFVRADGWREEAYVLFILKKNALLFYRILYNTIQLKKLGKELILPRPFSPGSGVL